MKYTSAEAAKLLRKLNDEKHNLLEQEKAEKEFLAALGEDAESVRPEYDYAGVQAKLKELDEQIRKVKHEINVFNLSTEVPGTGMTIDQILVYIPQLTVQKQKLSEMRVKLPKQRQVASAYGRGSGIIDYLYTNYDIELVKKDYMAVSDELAKVQTALDRINSTETMEICL